MSEPTQAAHRVVEAAREWHASGAAVTSPDGRAQRAIRNLRRAVAALPEHAPKMRPRTVDMAGRPVEQLAERTLAGSEAGEDQP